MTKQDFTKGLIGIGTSTLLGGMSGGFGTGLSGGAMNAAASFGVNTLASGIDVSGGGRVRYSYKNISGNDVATAGIGRNRRVFRREEATNEIRNKLMTGTLTNLMTAGYEGIANGHNFTQCTYLARTGRTCIIHISRCSREMGTELGKQYERADNNIRIKQPVSDEAKA